ncbi:MAG: oxidoreductase [Bacillota bacterium]|jgi:D-3-phosphoglycerate dehydrogenase|nr:oxidoreductase [Bacillota bacterium]
MKILTVTDLFIKKEVVEAALREKLSHIDSLEIENYAVDFPVTPLQYSDGEVTEFVGSEEDLIKRIVDVDHLVVHTSPVTQSVIEHGKKLKSISVTRGGAVNVNVEAATRKHIPVFNTPGRNSSAVAEFTIGLIISETRNIARSHETTRQGKWVDDYYMYDKSEYELSSKVIGLMGYGNIGEKVCKLLSGFGCKVLVYDPYISQVERNAELVDLDTLLSEADIISLHMRVTPETTGMINLKLLKRMKPSAILVNTARGPLVNYSDLYEALSGGIIARAALDTFESEPVEEGNPLLKLENVTLTNHIAGASRNAVKISADIMAEDLKAFLEGRDVRNLVNKDYNK